MDKDDALFQLLRDLRKGHEEMQGSLGRLEKGQESLNQYIGAVSQNTKDNRKELDDYKKEVNDRLQLHADDLDAHGMKQVKRIFSAIAAIITLAISMREVYGWTKSTGGSHGLEHDSSVADASKPDARRRFP